MGGPTTPNKTKLFVPFVFYVHFVALLLSQGGEGRCSDYRATQKGRGWLELVFQN